ncbi:putative necrosis-inducing factor-domain-containing protein [Xylariaceae sp. FL0662B]|nr:putative necrosis-inducing factor-domain-containing protein [Xylariaceae sp. FL0662B]
MCLRSHVNLTETELALAMITKAGVPSNKVIVGISSYGRSFAMAQAGCYGPDCFYTGTAIQSNAAPGPCTDTAGYIANAEIYDIVDNPSRVNQNFLDSTSDSRIVVYDDTQWVAFMDDSIRSRRFTLYKGLSMGGTVNWASDLESYHDAPDVRGSWDSFIIGIKSNIDPYIVGDRTGNWTEIPCTDGTVVNVLTLTPQQRWNWMDAPHAWSDVVDIWFEEHKPMAREFTAAVSSTIHGPENADCGSLLGDNNCGQTMQCSNFEGLGSGAAGFAIWNSFVAVHQIYSTYDDVLSDAAGSLSTALQDFVNNFAPIPEPYDDKWLQILLICLNMVGTVAVAGYFNTVLKALPYFRAHSASLDNLKDTSLAMVGLSTSIAGTFTGKDEPGSIWTEKKQDGFANYMGQVVVAWANTTEESLRRMFDGEPESVSLLTTVIADGQMIAGAVPEGSTDPDIGGDRETTRAELRARIYKSLFAFGIPVLWALAGTRPFIMDSGYDCAAVDPMGDWLRPETMHQTWGCYQNRLYYLADPSGDAQTCIPCPAPGCPPTCTDNFFSAPPGVDTLDGSPRFGGITVSDLITGSVRTYIQNGNANGGAPTDLTNRGSLSDLMEQDITTPGFIRIPVCSADVAFEAWKEAWEGGDIDTNVENYPCWIKPSISHCSDTTFVDQTSDASPSVDDCMTIVRNIQGTQGEWWLENAIGTQHQIAQHHSCAFGVQGLVKDGNINFLVGAQDIVDIITDAVSRFGGGGKVGAKGEMGCKGTVKTQSVEWGLYYDPNYNPQG